MKRIQRGIYERSGVLYVVYQDERKRMVWESTRQSTLKAARQILEKRKADVAMMRNFPARGFERVYFRDLAKNWWERHGKKTKSDFRYLYPRVLEGLQTDRSFIPGFGTDKARAVTSDRVQDFLDALRDDVNGAGLSASSANHHRTIINAIFNFAIERGEYDVNPVAKVPQFREPPGRDRFPTVEDFQKLMEACGSLELRAFVLVLSVTTLRTSDLLMRRWNEMRLEGPHPYVYIPEEKSGNPKRVPLPSIAVEALKALPSYGIADYVFPSRPTARFPEPKRLYRWSLGKKYRAACEKAGLVDLRAHDLRHMGASILTEQGISGDIIRKITGHRSRELERYQHLSEKLRSDTVDLIAGVLSGEITYTPALQRVKQEEEKEKRKRIKRVK